MSAEIYLQVTGLHDNDDEAYNCKVLTSNATWKRGNNYDCAFVENLEPHKGDLWWWKGNGIFGPSVFRLGEKRDHITYEVTWLVGPKHNHLMVGSTLDLRRVPYDPKLHAMSDEPAAPKIDETWESKLFPEDGYVTITKVTGDNVLYANDNVPYYDKIGWFVSRYRKCGKSDATSIVKGGERPEPEPNDLHCEYPQVVKCVPEMAGGQANNRNGSNEGLPRVAHWAEHIAPAEERRLIKLAMSRLRAVPFCDVCQRPVVARLNISSLRLEWICEA